jgi:outer membrane protein TolC
MTMADEPATPATPAFDPTAVLGKLEKIVNDNKAPSGGGSKSWIGTLIIIVVALAATAVFAWISAKNGRELAKLRHEKVKAQVEADQAKVDAQVAKDDAGVAAAQVKIDAAKDAVRVAEADIKAAEGHYEADLRAIDRIRSWDDVP